MSPQLLLLASRSFTIHLLPHTHINYPGVSQKNSQISQVPRRELGIPVSHDDPIKSSCTDPWPKALSHLPCMCPHKLGMRGTAHSLLSKQEHSSCAWGPTSYTKLSFFPKEHLSFTHPSFSTTHHQRLPTTSIACSPAPPRCPTDPSRTESPNPYMAPA